MITFEELGVDRLFIDEAHYYKNAFLYTKMRNVAGIAQNEAQKSADLYMKCRYLDEVTGGKGIVFATGTPISNSMTEMYTMQRYLQYGTLQKNGLQHFDAWASTFGETVTTIELAPEGTGYRAKTRFAKFYNTISINHTLVYYDHMDSLGTYYSMNTPKSQAGNRIIPMTEKVKEAFLMEKRLQEDAGITCDISIDGYTDFVFLNRFGKVQTMSMLNKALKRIMRDCNDQILSNAEEDEDVVLLPPFSCHVLRHTFATRLCESGMNIKVIQSVLGHADLSTTINTYIHATEDFKKEEFSKQSRYLSIGAADLESETILS